MPRAFETRFGQFAKANPMLPFRWGAFGKSTDNAAPIFGSAFINYHMCEL
jgi:hypothetical protein